MFDYFLAFCTAANLLYWSYQSANSCTVHVNENVDSFPKVATPEVSLNRSSTNNRSKPAVPPGGKNDQASLQLGSGLNSAHRRRRDTRMEHDLVSTLSGTTNPAITEMPTTESFVAVETVELDPSLVLLHDGDLHGVGSRLDSGAPSSFESEDAVEEDLILVDGSLEHAGEEALTTNEASFTTASEQDSSSIGTLGNPEKTALHLSLTADLASTSAAAIHTMTSEDSLVVTQTLYENSKTEIPPVPEVQSDAEYPYVSDMPFTNDEQLLVSDEERLQQDAPLYSYGVDNIEIIELKHDPEPSSFRKINEPTDDVLPKFESNHDLYKYSDENEVNRGVSEESRRFSAVFHQETYSDSVNNTSQIKSTTHITPIHNSSTVELDESSSPASAESLGINQEYLPLTNVSDQPVTADSRIINAHHAKRVRVNVTIAAEDSGDQHHTNQQVYVLSVEIPSVDDPSANGGSIDLSPPQQTLASVRLGLQGVVSNDSLPLPPKTVTSHLVTASTSSTLTPLKRDGHCDCSCPCLDSPSIVYNEQKLTKISGNDSESEAEPLPQENSGNNTSQIGKVTPDWNDNAGNQESTTPFDYDESTIPLNGNDITSDEDPTTYNNEEVSFEDSMLSTPPSVTPTETTTQQQCMQPTQPPPIILLLEGEKNWEISCINIMTSYLNF